MGTGLAHGIEGKGRDERTSGSCPRSGAPAEAGDGHAPWPRPIGPSALDQTSSMWPAAFAELGPPGCWMWDSRGPARAAPAGGSDWRRVLQRLRTASRQPRQSLRERLWGLVRRWCAAGGRDGVAAWLEIAQGAAGWAGRLPPPLGCGRDWLLDYKTPAPWRCRMPALTHGAVYHCVDAIPGPTGHCGGQPSTGLKRRLCAEADAGVFVTSPQCWHDLRGPSIPATLHTRICGRWRPLRPGHGSSPGRCRRRTDRLPAPRIGFGRCHQRLQAGSDAAWKNPGAAPSHCAFVLIGPVAKGIPPRMLAGTGGPGQRDLLGTRSRQRPCRLT